MPLNIIVVIFDFYIFILEKYLYDYSWFSYEIVKYNDFELG